MSVLRFVSAPGEVQGSWEGPVESVAFDTNGISSKLLDLHRPCYVVRVGHRIGASVDGQPSPNGHTDGLTPSLLAVVPPRPPERLGDPSFRVWHNARWAYATGSMAHGIASARLVSALGSAGILSSFGAAGVPLDRLEAALHEIRSALPNGPYAFNLIHSPSDEPLERAQADLYLRHQVETVEASAFLDLTPSIVRYRVAGLRRDPQGQIVIGNKVIAKLSRQEVARKFLSPPPASILAELVHQGQVSELQARLAELVPMCDDITVEADSGGHTDNRPLVCLLPSILELRNEIGESLPATSHVRIGAAGGVGTPHAALAAFIMGAAYVVTGSINQATTEAGTSDHVKEVLAQAAMADVAMAPAADMFEMGVRLQLLKRGSLYPMRAQWLYELFRTYRSIEEIPVPDLDKLERQLFKRSVEAVWSDAVDFFTERDPEQLARAVQDPRRKMALIFRWYLGMSSRWAEGGEQGREVDYQIWCGPAMGAFNDWVRGTYLEGPTHRSVVDVATHIMTGAAYLSRLAELRMQGLVVPARVASYRPARQLILSQAPA